VVEVTGHDPSASGFAAGLIVFVVFPLLWIIGVAVGRRVEGMVIDKAKSITTSDSCLGRM